MRSRFAAPLITVALTVGLVTPSLGHETASGPSSAELREEMAEAEARLADQADRAQSAQEDLEHIEGQIPDAQTAFETADRRLHTAEVRLAELEQQLADARAAEELAEQQLQRTERQYAVAVERLVATEAELEAQRTTLASQAAAFYKYGTTAGNRALVQSLSSSVSVSELSHQVHLAGEVADHQARIVERVAELEQRAVGERDRLSEVRERHDAAVAAAADARATVAALTEDQRIQVAALDDVRHEREQALVALQEEQATAQAAVQELEDESQAIEAMLADLAAAEEQARAREEEARRLEEERRRREEEERRRQEEEAAAERDSAAEPEAESDSGEEQQAGFAPLTWPANGPVTSPYGYRRHPIAGVDRLHAGIDIGAASGSPIVAAASGEVVYAGWYGGYGLAVVINHGDGYATLYAHQSSIAVTTGQQVGRGVVIGAVGTTGYSTGPHLHFEVRINGNPVDPMPYF